MAAPGTTRSHETEPIRSSNDDFTIYIQTIKNSTEALKINDNVAPKF